MLIILVVVVVVVVVVLLLTIIITTIIVETTVSASNYSEIRWLKGDTQRTRRMLAVSSQHATYTIYMKQTVL